MVTGYTSVSQAIRALAKSKAGGDVSDAQKHHHQCSYSTMMHGSGYPDLDKLNQDKSPLAFELELLRVELPGNYKPNSWAMTDEEILRELPKLKERGNSLYRSGDHRSACEYYREALGYLEQMSMKEQPDSDNGKSIEELKVPFLLNYSQCKFLIGDFAEVVKHTSTVLKFDPNNVKALYRRARAHAGRWNLPDAEDDFKKAAALDPSLSKAADKELTELKSRIRVQEMQEKQKLKGKLF